jgi:hypothetical protein
MNNIVGYSLGFLDGIGSGKKEFLDNLGANTLETMKSYIDTMAKVDPAMLHHIYEWNQTGSPSARLYDIDYTISNLGLSFKTSFRQSVSVRDGSKTPFYDKARIMENGIPVTIRPKSAQVLSFNDNGEQVFTKKPITIDNPGGDGVQGGFQSAFDSFFKYFSQAFLRSSGVAKYLENPVAYKKDLPAGRTRGKSAGINTGYRWIANAGVMQ